MVRWMLLAPDEVVVDRLEALGELGVVEAATPVDVHLVVHLPNRTVHRCHANHIVAMEARPTAAADK